MKRKRSALLIVVVAVVVALSGRSCSTPEPVDAPSPASTDTSHESPDEAPPERRPTRRRSGASATDVVDAESEAAADGAAPDPPAVDDAGDRVELLVAVRDASGRPVAGVEVRAGRTGTFQTSLLSGPPSDWWEPESESAPDERAKGITDAAGSVHLVSKRYDRIGLSAQSDAWAGSADVTPADADGPLQVVLTVVPAFRLSGRVVHDDGTPVSDASIFIAVPLPGRAARMPRRLEVVGSGEDGSFTTRSHPVPDTRIVECYVMANSVAGTSTRFPVTAGARDDVELVIQRGTVIRGRCVDEDGEPLVGVRVRGIMPGTGEITGSGPDGRFALPVPGKGGGLIFFLEGRVQTGLRDLRGPPEGVDVGDVLIPRGGTIAGHLVDENGAAIVGVEVLIVDPWTKHAAARPKSDANGAFRSDVIGAGTHYVLTAFARPDDPPGLHCYFRFDGLHAGDTELTLMVPRGVWVEVVVHDFANDEPIAFETGVFTLTRDDGSEFVPVHRVFETPGETRTSFMVQVPEPAAWEFEMELPDSGRVDRQTINVTEEQASPVVLAPR